MIKIRVRVGLAGLMVALVAACASSEVTERQANVARGTVARPERIIVCDFVAGTQSSPLDAMGRNCADWRGRRMTDFDETTAQLGDIVANAMVDQINQLGVRGERAFQGAPPRVGDIILTGEFVEVDPGNRFRRVVIGFGAGASELKTLVQAYQVTPNVLRPLGLVEVNSESGKMPGILATGGVGAAAGTLATAVVVGSAVAVGKEVGPDTLRAAANRTAENVREVIRSAFQRQGWI